MDDLLADIAAVTPGGLPLTPAERQIIKMTGVLAIWQNDGSTLVIWSGPQGKLYEQYYPAAKDAALERWREEYPDASAEQGNGP